MKDYVVIAQAVVSGLMQGGVYALICIGLTLIFGVMRIINFAHGEFFMVALFGSYFMATGLGIEPYLTAVVVLPGLSLFGLAVFRAVVTPSLKLPQANQVLLLIGLSLFLQNLALFLFSPDYRMASSAYTLLKFNLGSVVVSLPRLIAFIGSVIITGFLFWLMRFTELGRAIRAVAQDGEAAALMGINVGRVYLVAFAISAACLGAAAPLVLPFEAYVSPSVGTYYVLIAFVIVILGGLGNFMGTLAASFLIGVAESVGAVLLPGSTGPVLPFALLVLVLFLRPEGLFAVRA